MNKNAILTLTTLLGLAAGPIWADWQSAKTSPVVKEAKAYLDKGQLKAAEIQLKNALRDDPANLEARLLLGQVSLREGDGGAAELSFTQALQLNGDRAVILPMLGRAYLMQGKAEKILETMEPAGFPPATAALIDDLRADAEIIEKHPAEAREEAEKALLLQPEMPEALLILAMLRRMQGDDKGAEIFVDRALASSPADVPALEAKGELREALGDPRGAGAAFAKALAARPDDVSARLGEAAAFLASGDTAAARKDVDEILARQKGQPFALYLRALMLEREGYFAEALAALEPESAPLADDVAPQILLGELNLHAGHLEKAEAYALHALSLAPGAVGAKLLLALTYDRRNQPLKAVQLLEPLAAQMPDNGAVQTILGDSYGQLGRFDAAAKALEVAFRQAPSDSDLRVRLDASRIGAGDRDRGMKDLSDLPRSDPLFGRAGLVMISSTINAGHLAEALKAAVALQGRQAEDALFDMIRGRIRWMMGDWAGAGADFQAALTKAPAFHEAAEALSLIRQAQGRPDQAEAIFEAMLKRDPKDLPAMTALAGLAQSQGEQDKALGWLEKAIAAAPDSLECRARLIELLLVQNNGQKALAAAQALDRASPGIPQVIALLALAQLAAKQPDGAVLSWRQLAVMQSDPALGQIGLGRRLESIDRPADALAAYRKAVGIDPGSLAAWQALVVASSRLAGLDAALQSIATQLPPPIVPYSDALKGDAYLAVRHYAEAESAFRAAFKRSPEPWLMLRLAETQGQAGENAGELATLAAWLQLHPDDADSRAVEAGALAAAKEDAEAERIYLALLQVNPVNVAILNNLAWLYRTSDNAKALGYAHFAFGLAPRSSEVKDTLGWVLLQKGDLVKAKALLSLAHLQAPDDPQIAYHLAMALALGGDRDKARMLVKPLAERPLAFEGQGEAKLLFRSLGSTN